MDTLIGGRSWLGVHRVLIPLAPELSVNRDSGWYPAVSAPGLRPTPLGQPNPEVRRSATPWERLSVVPRAISNLTEDADMHLDQATGRADRG